MLKHDRRLKIVHRSFTPSTAVGGADFFFHCYCGGSKKKKKGLIFSINSIKVSRFYKQLILNGKCSLTE